jgi:hypothetical protein
MGQTLKQKLHGAAFRLERATQARKEVILLIIEAETPKLWEELQALSDEDLLKRAKTHEPLTPPAKPKAKAKPEAQPVTVTKESKKNAGIGREDVARGKRPPLKYAMVKVMGSKTMNAKGIVTALDAKGWLPSSNDPHQYISYMLSSNHPKVFERTDKRGYYRVRPGFKLSKTAKKAVKKAEPKAEVPKAEKSPLTPTEGLSDPPPKPPEKVKPKLVGKVTSEKLWVEIRRLGLKKFSSVMLSTLFKRPQATFISPLSKLVKEGKLTVNKSDPKHHVHRIVAPRTWSDEKDTETQTVHTKTQT